MLRWFHVEKKKTGCFYNPGLYTLSEVDYMVFVEGYIPVANIIELTQISTVNYFTMGEGTCWENVYLCGNDKKYIQVMPIDGANVVIRPVNQSPTGAGVFTGVYDGNNFINKNIVFKAAGNNTSGFFGSSFNAICKNLILKNVQVYVRNGGGTSFVGGVIGNSKGNSIFQNCMVEDSVIIKEVTNQAMCGGGFFGIISDETLVDNCITVNTEVVNDGTNNNNRILGGVGGFGGQVMYGAIVQDCICESPIMDSLDFTRAGGFVGATGSTRYLTAPDARGGTIVRCKVIGGSLLTLRDVVGGFIGLNHGVIRDCFSDCNIISQAVANRFAGGFCGYNRTVTDSYDDAIIENCYSIGSVDSAGGNYSGGFIGANYAKVTNSRADGAIIGNTNIAGFSGGNWGEIENSFSIGAPTATLIARGFCANNQGLITDSYWDTQTSGQATSSGGTGKTTSDLQTPTSNTGIYANYDPAIWDFGTSSEYPKLKNLPI